MNVHILSNSSVASKYTSEEILKHLKSNPNLNLGLPTGSTPVETYSFLVKDHEENQTSWENVQTFNLDEYLGMQASDKDSYRFFMQYHLFNKINIKPENTYVPLATGDIEKNIEEYKKTLAENPLDLMLLGVGVNGHLGFNEPGSSFDSVTRIVDLAPSTIEKNKLNFANPDLMPQKAISMGLKEIYSAKRIILLAFGDIKAEAVKNIFKPANKDWPCSYLVEHPNFDLVLDYDSAKYVGNFRK